MGLLSGLLKAAGSAAKVAANFLPIPGIARTAISMGIDSLSGGKPPSVTSLITGDTSTGVAKLFASSKNLPDLMRAQTEEASRLLDGQKVVADGVRSQREARADSISSSMSSQWGKDVVWSDDMVFGTIARLTTQTRVPIFGIPKPRSEFGAVAATPVSGLPATVFPVLYDFTAGVNGFGAVYQISSWAQGRIRAFFNTKSLFDITPVLTVIQKLWNLSRDLDNPYDFYNFFGYNGPEVVSGLAGLDLPIINAVLDRVSRHKTTKSLEQWFAAVAYFKEALGPYRRVTADWLGTEAGDLPAFLIDMLTFYLLTNWGTELINWMYDQDATIEMVTALPVSRLSEMHIYDKYDTLHHMLNGADTGYELVYAATPVAPTTDLQKNTWRLAAYHLLVLSNITMLLRNLISFSNFGVDAGDIADLYTSLTGAGNTDPTEYWQPIADLCNSDNADFIRLGSGAVADAIAQATISEAELVIIDEDDLISCAKLETMVKNIEQAVQAADSMSDVDAFNLMRVCESAASNLEYSISNNKVDEPSRAKTLLIRVRSAIAGLNSTVTGRR